MLPRIQKLPVEGEGCAEGSAEMGLRSADWEAPETKKKAPNAFSSAVRYLTSSGGARVVVRARLPVWPQRLPTAEPRAVLVERHRLRGHRAIPQVSRRLLAEASCRLP